MADDTSERMKRALGEKADWNLTLHEFERWSKMLMEGSFYAVQVRLGKKEYCKQLFAICNELADQWFSLVEKNSPKNADKLERMIKEAALSINYSIKTPRGVMIKGEAPLKIIELWRYIHFLKQEVGLGVPTRRSLTPRERLKRAMV